jgi:hypothetical protein
MANSTSYSSVRKIFGSHKLSENMHTIGHESDMGSIGNYGKNALPDITFPKDSLSITNRGYAYGADEIEELDYRSNLDRLKKIRNSVKSVDQNNLVRKKRLYQGIVVISEREFYIDIFKTKTKFYISAIDLSSKTPHMIELFINQGKKLIKECGDNFDNLVMRLEFKYDRFIIKDLNKLLYQDFASFAPTPRADSKNSKSPPRKPPTSTGGYKQYFKNKRGSKVLRRSDLNKSEGKLKIKSRLSLNKDCDSNGTILTQLQKLLK